MNQVQNARIISIRKCQFFTILMDEMAKVNDINIYRWLACLLDYCPIVDMSDEQLKALTPWSEEVQTVC